MKVLDFGFAKALSSSFVSGTNGPSAPRQMLTANIDFRQVP